MNERKVVNIRTGQVFTPPYLAERKMGTLHDWQWRGEEELWKDGTPHAGRRGHTLGVHRYGEGRWSGQFAFYDPTTEAATAPIRARIAELTEQLEAAEGKLFGHYAKAEP